MCSYVFPCLNSMHNFDISLLSPHLFWDIDEKTLSLETDKALIVQRVLEFGVMTDWNLLCKELGIESIAQTAKGLRSLDDISLNFISKLSGIPKSEFRCYTLKQSLPKHTRF
jgi:hypothetical protein